MQETVAIPSMTHDLSRRSVAEGRIYELSWRVIATIKTIQMVGRRNAGAVVKGFCF